MPTAKAFSLMTLLHGLGVPELFSPELTAEWEFKLAQMEHGQLARDAFMDEIVRMTEHIVGQAKNYESDTIPGDFATLGTPCPKCGGEVHEKYKKFQCENPACDFAFWKIMGGRQIEPHEAETLHQGRTSRPARGLSQQDGPAVLGGAQAERRQRGGVRLRQRGRRRRRRGARLLAGDAARCMPQVRRPRVRARQCRTCAKRRSARRNRATSAPAAPSCSAPIEPEQMQKLLASKKTDLLQFVSQRTRRPFSAFLVVQKDGKVGFEFEAKDPSKARGARGRAAALRVLGAHPQGPRRRWSS